MTLQPGGTSWLRPKPTASKYLEVFVRCCERLKRGVDLTVKCQASEAEDQTHSPANAPVAKEAFAPRRLAEKAMPEPGGKMLQ